MKLSIKQAFLTMFYLLEKYYEINSIDDLGALLGSLNPYLFIGNLPADAAIWTEWKDLISNEYGGSSSLTLNEAYKVMLLFLNHYCTEYGFNLNEVIRDLGNYKFGNKNAQKAWVECANMSLNNNIK